MDSAFSPLCGAPHNGVFVPNHRLLEQVTRSRRGRRQAQTTDEPAPARHVSMTWAQRLKRVFQIDIRAPSFSPRGSARWDGVSLFGWPRRQAAELQALVIALGVFHQFGRLAAVDEDSQFRFGFIATPELL